MGIKRDQIDGSKWGQGENLSVEGAKERWGNKGNKNRSWAFFTEKVHWVYDVVFSRPWVLLLRDSITIYIAAKEQSYII